MRTAIAAALAADPTLAGLLPGGVHAADEISRQSTPTAFDGDGFLRPCGLVKERAATPDLSAIPTAARETVEVYLYGPRDIVEAARRRARALLDGQAVALTAGVCLELNWLNDVRGWRDGALGCPAELSRYRAATIGG